MTFPVSSDAEEAGLDFFGCLVDLSWKDLLKMCMVCSKLGLDRERRRERQTETGVVRKRWNQL